LFGKNIAEIVKLKNDIRVHHLQNVPFEGLGSIESFLKQKDSYGNNI